MKKMTCLEKLEKLYPDGAKFYLLGLLQPKWKKEQAMKWCFQSWFSSEGQISIGLKPNCFQMGVCVRVMSLAWKSN